ncbi:MAG: isocitrate/isopropylmalate dehydrogenase family protein [Promethearchaeota archaeon]|nr:MAG: isocitrate/isopropylmalate dehydrogenase family protein [Candidatus Lokiarchaeota archaeon]
MVVLPGDGIGREVTVEAVKILKAVEDKISTAFDLIEFPCGGQHWLKSGKTEEWPAEAYSTCKNEADAILLGAIGWTNPDGTTVRYPDGRMVGLNTLFGLRFGLDLYANIRPTKLYEGVPHKISGAFRQVWDPKNVDFVVIRENTEGLYCDTHGKLTRGEEIEVATDCRLITKKGAERVIRFAFEYCKRRNKGAPKDKKLRVTCVDKSNVTAGCALFRSIYQRIKPEYPAIEEDYAFIDAFTQWIVRTPEFYDVAVVPNMFGDIATDLAAVLQGGMGMAASGNVGERHGMFEPIHGSAPRHAGKNETNPIAAILSVQMMLDWLSVKYGADLKRGANLVEQAVSDILKEGIIKTYDIGGSSKTSEVGDAIATRIKTIE